MNWFEFTLSVLVGLTTAVPLMVKLIEYVQKAVREKNWNALLDMVMDYMEIAENKFETGAERKEWVLSMVEAFSATVNYDVDIAVIDRLIDSLCAMTKVVNPPAENVGT